MPKGLFDSLVSLSKVFCFGSLAVLFSVVAYVVYTNPSLNHHLKEWRESNEKRIAEARSVLMREWKFDESSDVDVNDERYPIVVLRSGYKVIRNDPLSSVVGWKYEIINTSPDHTYSANVDFTLQDEDGLEIGKDSQLTIAHPGSPALITGTIDIANVDLARLDDSTWKIRLTPDWESAEKNTKDKRYDRLARIVKANPPSWMFKAAQNKLLTQLSPKWNAISNVIEEGKASFGATPAVQE